VTLPGYSVKNPHPVENPVLEAREEAREPSMARPKAKRGTRVADFAVTVRFPAEVGRELTALQMRTHIPKAVLLRLAVAYLIANPDVVLRPPK
jgi:hypothetical protein